MFTSLGMKFFHEYSSLKFFQKHFRFQLIPLNIFATKTSSANPTGLLKKKDIWLEGDTNGDFYQRFQ
jgi:hypothetical protein